MYGRYKNSWKQLSDAHLECMAKYSIGNFAGGDVSSNNAEEAYYEALKYFGKLSDLTSSDRWKLMDLVNQAKKAIATLPQPATH